MAIGVKDAVEALGLNSVASIYTSKEYKQFLTKAGGNSTFDIQGYYKWKGETNRLLEQTKLFVEYAHHIHGVPYADISRESGVSKNMVNKLMFGYSHAKKIADTFIEQHPNLKEEFEEYYK